MDKREVSRRYLFILYDVAGNEGAEGSTLYCVRNAQAGGKGKGIQPVNRNEKCFGNARSLSKASSMNHS